MQTQKRPGQTKVAVDTGHNLRRWPTSKRDALRALTRITCAVPDIAAELSKPGTLVAASFEQCPVASKPVALVCYALAWLVADELQIVDVATDPGFVRQGLARRTLLALLARAKSEGSRVALLEVRTSNQIAIALYETLGFSEARRRVNYYSDGDDALELQLTL